MKVPSETKLMPQASGIQGRSGDAASIENVVREIQSGFKGSRREGGVTALRHYPAREARVVPFPDFLPERVTKALSSRGVESLYSHQAAAATLAWEGRNIVVVTPTASGKTLCYNLPILSALVENPDARALYLFPTKALSQDQLVELNRWAEILGDDLRTFTYDGDTPQDARRAIRAQANLVITNPDMLHTGILPHHTKWERLFENLRYVVIDELHYYRGVFGSHLANVIRRLKRIAEFYGSRPQFICTSATIANPAELATRIIEQDVVLVDENGAPAAEKYFVLYNPPVVNPQLGIRRSYLNETRRLAKVFMMRGLETIVFANSRLATEILVTYLKEDFARRPVGPEVVRGYRGGYLPLERREIERDLREGRLLGVIATNALELGIDIGSLDVAVMAGYPGTIASTWQRAGRAGRREGSSAALLVASSAPLDQFIVQNPDYFFDHSPEHGHVNPDNLQILLNHLKCAAFELPVKEDEKFGGLDLKMLCKHLEDLGFLHKTSEGWHWISESYPADAISLRSVSSDNFVIVDVTGEPRVIGEVDFSSALTTVHEKAIYLQDGQQYHVERLDYDERKAYVRQCDSEYYTDAISYTKIKILEHFDSAPAGPAFRNHGEVQVNTQVVGFKKIKFHTMQNVGSGELMLPEQEMHTTAFWLTLPQALLDAMPYSRDDRMNGVQGLAHALQAIGTLLMMCDARDLGVAVGENLAVAEDLAALPSNQGRPAVYTKIFEPNIYLYDKYPGGVGFSEPLFRLSPSLLENTRRLILNCPCESGCPSCVGPVGEVGEKGKEVALAILSAVLQASS
ncbi:MAG TPA: DEAD/DEAH box helicase [Terriglobia bacterium]|nr:DEAD/DEAH box helicase [Terriglobia bacterium]